MDTPTMANPRPDASAPDASAPGAPASTPRPPPMLANDAAADTVTPLMSPELTRPKLSTIKELIMDTTSNYANGIKDIMAEAQEKAKDAFAKSNSLFGDANDFARGNVEAVVESGKILAAGLQDMATNLASESRSVFEGMTADLKDLAAAKTPADFLKMQSEMLRKSFDSAVSYGSKNSEAMLKLANEVFAPISGRVSMAVEKARKPESTD